MLRNEGEGSRVYRAVEKWRQASRRVVEHPRDTLAVSRRVSLKRGRILQSTTSLRNSVAEEHDDFKYALTACSTFRVGDENALRTTASS